jgi:hypothetical protein
VSEWYDWRHGRVTVLWPILIGDWEYAAGVLRVHDDPEIIPGDYHCAGTIIVKDKRFEMMGFVDKEKPKAGEIRAFYSYLASLGLTRSRHVRAKGGDVHFVETA